MSTSFRTYIGNQQKNKEIKDRLAKIRQSSDKIYTESLCNLKGEVNKENQMQSQLQNINSQIEEIKMGLKILESNNTPTQYRSTTTLLDKQQKSARQIQPSRSVRNLQNVKLNDVYVFCFFSRINKSPFIQMQGLNTLVVNKKNKNNEIIQSQKLSFQHPIITSPQQFFKVFDVFPTTLILIGSKSSGKQQICQMFLDLILKRVIEQSVVDVNYQICCTNIDTKLPESKIYNEEFVDVFRTKRFWDKIKSDPYYEQKKKKQQKQFIGQQTHEKQQKKQTQQLNCIKILKIDIYQKQNQLKQHYLITSNQIPLKCSNKLYLDAISKSEKETIYFMNPLKYRINECLETLEHMIHSKQK